MISSSFFLVFFDYLLEAFLDALIFYLYGFKEVYFMVAFKDILYGFFVWLVSVQLVYDVHKVLFNCKLYLLLFRVATFSIFSLL